MKSPSTTTETHWAILAGLRFFLAAIVVLGHFSLFIRPDPYRIFGDGYLNPLSAVFGFFILSGYSIAASLDRESAGFCRRRVLRIWPLYLAAIAFGLAIFSLSPTGFAWPVAPQIASVPDVLQIVASLLMLQTIISPPIATIGPIWSISGEWWHYMIAPALNRLSNKILLVWMAASFVLFIHLHEPGPGIGCIGCFPDAIPVAALSWVWLTGFVYYRLRGTASGFTVLFAPALFALTIQHSPGVPMFITAFVLILSESRRGFSKRAIASLNFLGDWSYPLYLFHFPSFLVALTFGSNRSAITLGSAFLVSLIALYAVDYPARRIFRKKRAATAPAT